MSELLISLGVFTLLLVVVDRLLTWLDRDDDSDSDVWQWGDL